jgi:hypothetical protein
VILFELRQLSCGVKLLIMPMPNKDPAELPGPRRCLRARSTPSPDLLASKLELLELLLLTEEKRRSIETSLAADERQGGMCTGLTAMPALRLLERVCSELRGGNVVTCNHK